MSISTEDLAYLAKDAYVDDRSRPLNDWNNPVSINGHFYVVIDSVSNPLSGYQARAYQRTDTGEVVIAQRGTEPTASDAITDLKMVRDQTNQQWPDAQKFTERVLAKAKISEARFGHPIDITTTGHSLGGTLAELTAAKYHLHGETFNSYGAVDLIYGFHPDSADVVNHVIAGDVVSAASHHADHPTTKPGSRGRPDETAPARHRRDPAPGRDSRLFAGHRPTRHHRRARQAEPAPARAL